MGRKRKEPGGRGVGEFELGTPATRKNSASIRRLLHDIIIEEFGNSLERAAAGLTHALNAAEDQREYRRESFTKWTAYRVWLDERTITFNELDSMGLYHRIPLALVVLFTQIRSEVHSARINRTHRAERTLRAFRRAFDDLEAIVKTMPDDDRPYDYFSYEKFLTVRNAYREEFGDDLQADLPLFDSSEEEP